MKLGATITKLRQQKGWTHAELAQQLGMHPNHVGRWEKNQMRPRSKTLEKLAELFGVQLDELVASESEVSAQLARDDPELAELVVQIPTLDQEEKAALRLFLRSMLTCKQMEHLALRRKSLKTA
jgi:transcriptional regulator with XRE-family HTH domain